jgi:SAM-dependent methyltransferase
MTLNRFCFYAGLFTVTAATLMLQLIQTRMLSVVAWYHLAFFVISTAMFGLTAGAVWVYLRGARYTETTLSFDLAHYTTAFAVSAALALAVQVTLVPVERLALTTIVVWTVLALLLSIPFFFSGIVVSLALTRSPFSVGRVYAVDLMGAAVGCFGVLWFLETFNGPSAALWTATLAALGAMWFSRSGIGGEPEVISSVARLLRWRSVWLIILVVLAAFNSVDQSRRGLYPLVSKGQFEPLPWFEKWNSFSRVVAFEPERPRRPSMAGVSSTFPPEWSDTGFTQMLLNIDGDASTVGYGIAGDLSRAEFLRYDLTNLAYYLRNRRTAAIIGVGGGRDLIAARVFGVEQVTGVEINPVFVNLLLRDPRFSQYVGLNRLDGVSLVVDEARSWFARTDQTFDVVQMSLIDTWAATGAGAFTLTENGLYTMEAWQIFLRRLNPQGVFTVSRWYRPDDLAETGRMVSLAVGGLLRSGVAPENHVYLAGSSSFGGLRRPIATLVVSPSGFSESELESLKEATTRLQFEPLIVPGAPPASEALGALMRATTLEELNAFGRGFRLDLTPPTDDRPFFFNQLPFRDVAKMMVLVLSGAGAGTVRGNLRATVTLAVLFFISLGLVIAAVLIPLQPAVRDAGARLAAGGTAYFMLIGIGFMLVEIGFLQRFSIFLGHPTYSLSIVLSSLILSTGIGSLISDFVGLETRGKFTAWAVATAGYIVLQTWWVPSLLLSFDSSSLSIRAMVSLAIILPAGLLMGFGFPTGMRLIAAIDRKPTPWFWGINGASGVLSAVVAVACSIAYGIAMTLMLAAMCYLMLVPAAMVIGFVKDSRPAAQNRQPIAAA